MNHQIDPPSPHTANEASASPFPGVTPLLERERDWDTPQCHNLPAALDALVGRAEELAAVHQLLRDKRLVTLTGPGGVGKSRLALQVAWESLPHYHHGVYLAPLAGVSGTAFLVPAIAEALGFSFYSRAEPQQQLLDFLRAKELLLVLDNFEHLLPPCPAGIPPGGGDCASVPERSRADIGGASLLPQILAQASGVKLLVTSRERLNLRGEWVFELRGLPCPPDDNAGELTEYDAVRLYLQSARKAWSGFALAEADAPHVRRICRLVEGLPLALELAATWVKALSCREIAQEIAGGLDFLTSAWRDAPARHRSLRAVCEHSWQLLHDREREVFSRLSAFQGGFGREAAARVAGATLPVLSSLVDQSLLRWDPSAERYLMHEVLKQYAAEKLAQAPEKEQRTQVRHCEYFMAWLHKREGALHGHGQRQALQEIGAEMENVRAAWEWAAQQAQAERVEQGLESLYRFYEMRGWLQEGEAAFAKAVEGLRRASGSADPQVVWKLLARQGTLLAHLDFGERATELLEKSLSVFQAHGDQHEVAVCLLGLAYVATSQGNQGRAKKLLKQALTLTQMVRLHHLEAQGLSNLGYVSMRQGNYASAKAYCEQALHTSRELGDRWREGAVLVELSAACSRLSEHLAARAHCEQALEISREFSDRWSESVAWGNLGIVLVNVGDLVGARACFEQALNIGREIGSQTLEVQGLHCLSLLTDVLGENDTAQRYSQQALRIARDLNNLPMQGRALKHLGQALEGLGRLPEALATYRDALTLLRDAGQQTLVIESQAGLARVFLAQGESVQALAKVEEVLEYLETHTHTGTEEPLRLYLTCYQILRANQDPRSDAVLDQAHQLLEEWAGNIEDQELRRSFLENIPAHREIQRVYRATAAQPAPSTGPTSQSPALVEPLTPRQTEVLQLIVAGLTNKEIAERLVISPATVKHHVWHIYGKLEVRNRAEAIKRARELGLSEGHEM